jgi:DNA-3-methyladenine glycosylase
MIARPVLEPNDVDWRSILDQPAHRAAPRLIGWELAIGGVRARITETEAYHSVRDLACHASKGHTPRTATLFAPAGTLYVYLCYGMHWMLNLVCDREGMPSAVLIRGVEIIEGHALVHQRRGRSDAAAANGPGKVCAALGLDRAHHGQHLDTLALRLLPPTRPRRKLHRGPRVGVDYAGPVWAAKRWRWWENGFPAVRNGKR